MFALVDCNNFYASCERVFNPKLIDRPIVVLSNNDGCVIARSQEAKDLGIKMGEPSFLNKDLYQQKNVAVYSSNYELYGDMSARVMNTLAGFVPEMEVYSIDEAFLNIKGTEINELLPLGFKIRKTVLQWVGIPVGVGIAPTKTLAKVANKLSKKHGGVYMLVDKSSIENALKLFPVEDLWGIGRQLARWMQANNIKSALELREANEDFIRKKMGVLGVRMINELKGISCIDLDLVVAPKQAICTSRSFSKTVNQIEVINEALATFTAKCAEKLRNQKSCATLLTVFLHTNPFANSPQYSASKTIKISRGSNYTPELIHLSQLILKNIYKSSFQYKKAGIIVTGIVPENEVQGSLWDSEDRAKGRQLMRIADRINKRYGFATLRSASQGSSFKGTVMRQKLSSAYTTKWNEFPCFVPH